MNRSRALKRRRDLYPSRGDLKNKVGAERYCRKRKLSSAATRRVVSLVTGTLDDIDSRDLRRVGKIDRVPRSLETWSNTPPRYWDIDI